MQRSPASPGCSAWIQHGAPPKERQECAITKRARLIKPSGARCSGAPPSLECRECGEPPRRYDDDDADESFLFSPLFYFPRREGSTTTTATTIERRKGGKKKRRIFGSSPRRRLRADRRCRRKEKVLLPKLKFSPSPITLPPSLSSILPFSLYTSPVPRYTNAV